MKQSGYFGIFTSVIALGLACSVYTEDLLETEQPSGGGTGNGGNPGGSSGDGGAGANGGGGGGATSGGSGGGPGGTGGGGTPTGGSGGSAGTNACNGSVTFPKAQAASDIIDPNGNVGEQTSAMYTIDLGDRDPNLEPPPTDYLSIGYDIDNTCTRAENINDGECILPEWSSGNIDGPMGIDNALGGIIQRVRQTVQNFSSEIYTDQLRAGGVSVLYRVRGYNGEPNDGRVTVAIFVAAPFESTNGAGAVPNWDGDDVWPVVSDSVVDPDAPNPLEQPKWVDDRAYVTDGKLVVTLPETNLRLDVALSTIARAKLNMKLTQAYSVCDLVESSDLPGRWYVDNCVIAGRWESDHLLQQLSQFSDPTSSTGLDPLCTDNGLYSVFKGQICSRTDVNVFTTATGNTECDALSVGIKFSTRPALLGDLWILDEVVNRCPTETDPSGDSCENVTQ